MTLVFIIIYIRNSVFLQQYIGLGFPDMCNISQRLHLSNERVFQLQERMLIAKLQVRS